MIAEVRAKFVVEEMKQDRNGYSIKLTPVCNGSPENENFFKWTPWGSMEIGTINETVAEKLKVGEEFYIDFIKA